MAHLFPTCAETARRISQAQDIQLPAHERLGLYLHLAACSVCRRYLRQMKFLRGALGEHRDRFDEGSKHQLSSEARQRITQSLSSSP